MAEDNAYAIGSIETKFPDPSGVSKLLLFDCTKEQYSIIDTVRWQGQKQSIPLTLIRDSRNCCFSWLGLKEISSNWNGVLIFAQYTHDLLGRNFKRSVRSCLLWDTSAAAPATMLVFWDTHTPYQHWVTLAVNSHQLQGEMQVFARYYIFMCPLRP